MATGEVVNIIKKIEVVEGHGHHGGAWKVAYADFMTAMMAFFLLMWILSSSDEQKLRGIAEYFTNATLPGGSGVLDGATLGPPGTLTASNGATVARGSEFGEVDDPSPAKWEVMDTTPTGDPEEKVRGSNEGHHDNPAAGAPSDTYDPNATVNGQSLGEPGGAATAATDATDPNHAGVEVKTGAAANAIEKAEQEHAAAQAALEEKARLEDEARFEEMKAEILQAMQAAPDLAPLQKNLMFEKTPEGMRIQIVDQKGQPMFASGSAKMNSATTKLMNLLGESLTKLPNDMVISGHTDAVPFSSTSYDNWDLSSDRANAMRRVLLGSGIEQTRITRVSGMAATQLLKPEMPKDPSNRRIEVLLAYEKPMMPPAPAMPKTEMAEKAAPMSGEMADAMEDTQVAKAMPTPSVAEQVLPAEKVTVLDENIFQNLRSALR